jgi:hypothetical protein
VELTDEEIELIIEALHDAAFYRDSRAHVMRSVVRRKRPESNSDAAGEEHRSQARAYEALVLKLKRGR